MSPGRRRWVFLAAALVLGVLLIAGFNGIPAFGHYRGPYGLILDRREVRQRRATDVVTAVVFDYRGVDTMGEEFILFAAAIGVALLLRTTREEEEREPGESAERRQRRAASEAVRALGTAFVGLYIVLGLYVVTHGQLTPGGGFQGGAILAAAAIIVFLLAGHATFQRLTPMPLIDLSEGAAAAAFPAVGALGLVAGSAFLANVLPLGRPGDLLSAGTLPVLNLCVGLGVSAGFVLILSEFLQQTMVIRKRKPR